MLFRSARLVSPLALAAATAGRYPGLESNRAHQPVLGNVKICPFQLRAASRSSFSAGVMPLLAGRHDFGFRFRWSMAGSTGLDDLDTDRLDW